MDRFRALDLPPHLMQPAEERGGQSGCETAGSRQVALLQPKAAKGHAGNSKPPLPAGSRKRHDPATREPDVSKGQQVQGTGHSTAPPPPAAPAAKAPRTDPTGLQAATSNSGHTCPTTTLHSRHQLQPAQSL